MLKSILRTDYKSKYVNVPLFFLFILISTNITTYANIMAYIDSLLISTDFRSHQLAVDMLTKGADVDTITATVTLINALSTEVENPTSKKMAAGSYFTITGFIQHHYMIGLARLGNTSKDSLFNRLDKTTGAFRNSLIIALGFMNDQRVHNLLGSIYYNNSDPFMRYEAILALRGFKDSSDVPIFMDALNDKYYVIRSGYVSDTENTRDHIIRAESAGALIDNGYQIKRKGDNYIVLGHPQKK
jgi:hypothetical protein